jgi:hypothetical protein
MLAPHDARITGLRCLEPGSGSAAGVVAAGDPLEVALAVEAGAALFATGARFALGVQLDGAPPIRVREGHLGDATWPAPVSEVRVAVPGSLTTRPDRVLGVVAFLRVNAAAPFLVSVLRGPDLLVTPAPLYNSLTNGP